jgi:hypothetical protein
MTLVSTLEEGRRSMCEPVLYLLTTLESCLNLACMNGSNTINYRNTQCEVLRCFGTENLDVSSVPPTEACAIYTYLGEYDIYNLITQMNKVHKKDVHVYV